MTLTTLSSKELGVLYKWALKRNKALIIVYSIILFIGGPVLNMYAASISYIEDVNCWVGIATLGGYTAIAALFTLISAVATFSFMHNKRSVDMYGALPCNRSTLFMSHLLAGLTAIAGPYFIASIITVGISIHTVDYVKYSAVIIFSALLMIVASYIFTALIAYCCGTIIDTLIATIAINGIWIVAVATYFGFLGELIPGMTFDSILNTPLLTAFTPYGFGYMGMWSYFGSSLINDGDGDITFFVAFVIWSLIFIVGTFFATLVLANRRKAESSQNGFAVKWLPMAVKAGASVISGALLGFIFASTSASGFGNMFVYTFWYIVGSAVAFFVLHVIFSRGIKSGLVKSVIVYTATSIAAIVLVFGMCFGMGIDTHVPSAGIVKSVQMGDYHSQFLDNKLVFKESENIELITEIHQIIVDGIRKENDYPNYFGYSSPSNYYDYEEVSDYSLYDYVDPYTLYPYISYFDYEFKYNMKVGFDVSRDYYISLYSSDTSDAYDLEKLNELTKQLVSSEEFKRQSKNLIFNEDFRAKVNLEKVNLENYSKEHEYYNPDYEYYSSSGSASVDATDEKFLNGLFEALQKDILADDSFTPTEGGFDLGDEYLCISFSGTNDDDGDYYGYYTSGTGYVFCEVIVKESYTNTLKFLDTYNLEYSTDNNYDYYSYFDYEPRYFYYYDTEIYDSMYDYSYSGEFSDWRRTVGLSLEPMAELACETNVVDYDTWYTDYFSEFTTELYAEADRQYENLLTAKNSTYSGTYSDYDYYCPDMNEIFMMLDNLTDYAIDYVKNCEVSTDTSDTDTETDKDNSSDTSSKSESESEGKAESNTESSKDENVTESTAESTSSKKETTGVAL